MAAFKPYRFIIFDQQIKNNQFYKSIITQLNLSLLCKEIYLNEAFSCYQYEKLFLKNLVYYSVNNLGNGFNARRLKCSGQSSVDPGENKLEQLMNNEKINGNINQSKNVNAHINQSKNVNVHINQSKNVNNIYHNKCIDIPSDYHNTDESESMNHLNMMDDLEERHKNDPLYNLMIKNKNTKNKKLITQSDINNLVSFHIYDNKNKNTFKNILSLNDIYNIDHINILCLNNYKPILNILKNYSINKRISIYYPFYIINDDKNNKSQNNLYTKVADYCYNIVSDILPLRYKNINLSDIIRAIIINTELCHSEGNKNIEVLKFVDIMDIIGSN
ncbi:conserved Plasmodium protein, unknown function [Plasmodium sp. DRC-Itaito]|uniref:Uncharacterized protein n=1 Tax=Plasmodium gaboni TaxID=647221 RepID=A0ABY1UML9_9APIC|nr:conserved Plasmodium protein, unknown function [Plasmodium gaboni]SOV22790.1 conserved Plasmodium protein, unknown function [Plasmodium sp. DRC-Itaito]